MNLRATILTVSGAVAALFGLAAPASAQGAGSDAERAWLNAHNEARLDFGTPPLQWSASLTQEASQWAEHLARTNTMRHSTPETRAQTGENLWMGTAGYYTPGSMIGFFVNEQRYFRAGYFPEVSRTGSWADVGHYTQVVWPSTREVGCAKASNAKYDFLVCRYFPAGNVEGERMEPRRHIARR
ncbi:SCP-like extracellular [Erythrobacter sp. SCSIO 43205]|uniref:CAP domain-containing protein n=1 Tax=Erythrobacter sp. SCSIO 43205 TaxID=2779361 RepID=UPI001CA80D5C|nr:CAP domain-containing protein [Erythrobacter sp. SCSIO 43205]UAB77143.1 SCP-like extracellular [Erythrobacter sp. SCSIO 43205]